MTLAARDILSDCETILEMMEVETNPKRLRVLWIGALAILRMVGHILDKVDCSDPKIRLVVDEKWSDLKCEPIFSKFIEKRRNLAIKKGEVGLRGESEITVLIQSNSSRPTVATFQDCLFMPLESGFRAGEDGRDVYRDAIDWWDAVLEEIESV
ncbi:hypothetical protein ACQKOE_00950 [Novosphingobium sp. NPDC080210]|uniref:hypothetical protein n=1 Tax=Novosphingobium sp. NPDC080210 TaxID=3390596 RepID=UPI003D049E3D